MTKFIIGGQGPDNAGLGEIPDIGIFKKAKVIFETDDKVQIQILRNTTGVTEIIETEKLIIPVPSIEVKIEKPKSVIASKKKGVK